MIFIARFFNPNASNGNLYFGDPAESSTLILRREAGTGDFVITGQTSGERMRVTYGGNVGIGTTSPGTRLQVTGSLSADNGTDQTVAPSNRGRFFSKTVTVTGGAGATTIKDKTGPEGSLYVVAGYSTAGRFVDLVLFSGTGNPAVVSSIGTPATRTYSRSAENFQLSLDGVAAFSIFVTGIGNDET